MSEKKKRKVTEFWDGWYVTQENPGQRRLQKLAGAFITEADAKSKKAEIEKKELETTTK